MAGSTLASPSDEAPALARPPGSPGRETWRRFRRHRLALASVGVLALLVGGVVFVEKIFSWPGMGLVAVKAVASRDYALVTGVVTLGAVAVAAGALVADLLHAAVDPRVRD